MKNITLYLLLFFISLPVFAQHGRKSSYDKGKLESAKVAFITQRLDLSPDQAEKFWPLYNQHNKDRRTLMKQIDHLLDEDKGLTNAKALELIEKRLETEQKILDLEKKFLKKIVATITPIQALKLNDVSKDFARHIYRMQNRQKNE